MNRYAYADNSPANAADPYGNVKWDASIFSIGGGRLFGGAFFNMTFVSECINGSSVVADVMAVGFGVGVGIRGTAVAISTEFEDFDSEPNAANLRGSFAMMGIGATVSPVPQMFIGGPGVGVQYGWMQVGRAFATPGPTGTLGFDLSALALWGRSWIVNEQIRACDCGQ